MFILVHQCEMWSQVTRLGSEEWRTAMGKQNLVTVDHRNRISNAARLLKIRSNCPYWQILMETSWCIILCCEDSNSKRCWKRQMFLLYSAPLNPRHRKSYAVFRNRKSPLCFRAQAVDVFFVKEAVPFDLEPYMSLISVPAVQENNSNRTEKRRSDVTRAHSSPRLARCSMQQRYSKLILEGNFQVVSGQNFKHVIISETIKL